MFGVFFLRSTGLVDRVDVLLEILHAHVIHKELMNWVVAQVIDVDDASGSRVQSMLLNLTSWSLIIMHEALIASKHSRRVHKLLRLI